MSGFQMVGTTDLQNVRFSNDSGIRMSGFRIPAVFDYGMNHIACISGLTLRDFTFVVRYSNIPCWYFKTVNRLFVDRW